MTPGEIEVTLQRLRDGAQTARVTIAQLVQGGAGDETECAELVFISLGGSDLVEVGGDGLERYHGSGKLVREVAAEMAKDTSSE